MKCARGIVLGIAVLAVAAGCGDGTPAPLPDLASTTYVFPAFDSLSVQMTDGEGVVDRDGVTLLRAGVTDWVLQDDIDEDGTPEAIVVVWSSGGGGGTYYDVALLELAEGAEGEPHWAWRGSTTLGDRVRVRALTLASDVLGVHLTRHGPDDEMCCPTEEVELHLRVGDRTFTEIEGNP
jgi:hypothetical protein